MLFFVIANVFCVAVLVFLGCSFAAFMAIVMSFAWDKLKAGRILPQLGNEKDLDKYVIVTGGGSGIGKETVVYFLKRGAHVLFTSKNQKEGHSALDAILDLPDATPRWQKQLEMRVVDLSSFEEVRSFANDFIDSETPIDIIICCAGVMIPQTTAVFGDDGYEMTWTVNFLSQFLLVQLLMPIIEASSTAEEPSRIVFVSSSLHWYSNGIDILRKGARTFSFIFGTTPYGLNLYGSSKLAVLLAARELNYRLRGTNVDVVSVHPGAVATSLFDTMNFWARLGLKILSKTVFLTPYDGKDMLVYAALAPPEEVRGQYLTRSFSGEAKQGWMSGLAKSAQLQVAVYENAIRMVSNKRL